MHLSHVTRTRQLSQLHLLFVVQATSQNGDDMTLTYLEYDCARDAKLRILTEKKLLSMFFKKIPPKIKDANIKELLVDGYACEQFLKDMSLQEIAQMDEREMVLGSTTLGKQKVCDRILAGCTQKMSTENGFQQFWALKMMAEWVAKLYADNDPGNEATTTINGIKAGAYTEVLSLALGATVWEGKAHGGMVMTAGEFVAARKSVEELKTYTQQCYKFVKGYVDGDVVLEKGNAKRKGDKSGRMHALGGKKKKVVEEPEKEGEEMEALFGAESEVEESGNAGDDATASSAKKKTKKKKENDEDGWDAGAGWEAVDASTTSFIPEKIRFVQGDSTSKDGWKKVTEAMWPTMGVGIHQSNFNVAHRGVVFTSPPWGVGGFGAHDAALGKFQVGCMTKMYACMTDAIVTIHVAVQDA